MKDGPMVISPETSSAFSSMSPQKDSIVLNTGRKVCKKKKKIEKSDRDLTDASDTDAVQRAVVTCLRASVLYTCTCDARA